MDRGHGNIARENYNWKDTWTYDMDILQERIITGKTHRHGTWTYWVNPSKRGGIDGVFQGLAGLL